MTAKLLRYFPQFFRASRPYVRDLEADLAAARRENRITPSSSYAAAARRILAAYAPLGIHTGDPEFPLQAFSQEAGTALTYGQWGFDGSVVFDFEPALCEAFLQSDVDEIRLSDLNFPYRSCYFHFGSQKSLPLYDGALHAEGAYLLYSPDQSLRVVVVARYPEATRWADRAREGYQLKLATRHFDIDLGTAIDLALAEDLEDLSRFQRGPEAAARPRMAAKVEGFIEAHGQNQATLRKVLRLAVNGLSYLAAYPEDAESTWQPGTPERLMLKAQHGGSAKERERARSKLISQGFVPVHRVGQAFQLEVANFEGGHRKMHWRRGHWRRQAHGPGRAQRKLVWIRPARVAGTDEGAEGGEAQVFKVV
jgi:hypothetical protein